MEQHPVPQNVTTFQFRLIGDMTLKQFGYLVGGSILAYIMYKLPLPFFLGWPLALFFALAGVGFAFVPIEERPMDIWVLSFIKSIYSPTQYIWSQRAQPTQAPISPPLTQQPAPAPATRKEAILNNIFLPNSEKSGPTAGGLNTSSPSVPKKSMFDLFFGFFIPKPHVVSPQAPSSPAAPVSASPIAMPARQMDFSHPPIVQRTNGTAAALAQAQQKESALEDKLKKLSAELKDKTAAESRATQLQAQLSELLSEKEKMAQELETLRKQSMPPPVQSTRPPSLRSGVSGEATTTTTQTPASPTIQIIAPGRAATVGLPRLTTFPNIVTGIVKDKDKNLLPGVLVTVKDKDGIPLRALKTNRLGQFAASTQLPNGTYLVEIEDPRLRYVFDRAQITLNGSVVPALEIFAKTEKEITRAKLEKELFGKLNT